MTGLEYSTDALEAKGLFYNKLLTVYVEGPDDVVFWNNIFQKANVSAYIEEVGGKLELEKKYFQILNMGVEFCIAMDNDNSEFMNANIEHPRIIKTYGYSIENSMYYNKNIIASHISSLSRNTIDNVPVVENWIIDFSNSVEELIVYDIANNKFKKGISVFGDNCCRFFPKSNSYKLSTEKIEKFIDSIQIFFDEAEINEVKESLRQNEKELWFLIKGHFISHSLINLIKNTVKYHSSAVPSISSDILYSLTVNCDDNFEGRPDIDYIIQQIRNIPMN